MANNIGELKRQFGERVRRLRLKRKWNQFDLSAATGYGRVFLSNLENGKHEPKLRTIMKIAEAFDMTISQLMRGL
jgi:transcriptional regulator with XRE-family HTH domain